MKIFCVISLLAITVVGGAVLDGLEDHHHDEHHDFPLATGKETGLASARLIEFFNAVLDDEVPLPSDMPSYRDLPVDIEFSCADKLQGYYADVNYGCQVYHMCRDDPQHEIATFLCPNATVFHQEIFACDWWFNVDCSQAPAFYHLNADIYKEEEEEEEHVNAIQGGQRRE